MINERSSPEPGSTCRIGSFGAVRTCSKNTQGLSRAADAILHLLAKMNSSIDRCASRRADKAGPAYTAIDSMMEGEMEEKVTTEMTSCDHWLLCIRERLRLASSEKPLELKGHGSSLPGCP
ncbi:uncharacterized protein LOC144007951 isoform X2 [Festucalex cinctus]